MVEGLPNVESVSDRRTQILLETLDSDGGGDIDFAEFLSFWNAYTFD